MVKLNPSIDEIAADALRLAPASHDLFHLFGQMLSAYGYVVKRWGTAIDVVRGRAALSGDWQIEKVS